MPTPDPDEPLTALHGQASRVVTAAPPVPRATQQRLGRFAAQLFATEFRPLEPQSDLTLTTYLENVKREKWWKDALREAAPPPFFTREMILFLCLMYDSFIKFEFYDKTKKARTITGPPTVAKSLVGPWFHMIGKVFFAMPFCSKGVPYEKLASYVWQIVGGGECHVADHSSFEGHFATWVLLCIEVAFYKYMTALVPGHEQFWLWLDTILIGDHKVRMGSLTLSVPGKRMSGDMCTSLGNTLTSYVLIKFIEKETGSLYRFVVEGDDSILTVVHGRAPQPADYLALGFEVKMETFPNFERAGYCHCYPLPSGGQGTDPIPVLAKFPWLGKQYLQAGDTLQKKLLRLKALSLLAAYRCPMLNAFGAMVLRLTADQWEMGGVVERMRVSEYEKDWLKELVADGGLIASGLAYKATVGDRLTMFELFGVTPAEQETFERWCESNTSLGDVRCGGVSFPDAWHQYAATHISDNPRAEPLRQRSSVPITVGVWEEVHVVLQRHADIMNL